MDFQLNEDSLIPLYQQLMEDIKAALTEGKYAPDEKIPSESELSELYHVSRITVRRAVEEMGGAVRQLVPLPAAKHVFTHVEWHMTGWRVELESARGLDPSLVFTTERQRREQYAVPSAYRAYLKPSRRR